MCCRVSLFFRTALGLPTICQNVLHRFLHFSSRVSNFIHYVNMCEAVSPFFSTGLVLPTLYQHVLQRLLHFSELVSYYLHYINMSYNGYVVLQNESLITYNMSTYDAAGIPFFSNDHVLPTLCQLVLQRLLQFTSLVSYYLHSVNMCCSGYFIF
jgi:hypothetical protein